MYYKTFLIKIVKKMNKNKQKIKMPAKIWKFSLNWCKITALDFEAHLLNLRKFAEIANC